MTATPTGGTSLEYQFDVGIGAPLMWTTVQPFSAAATCTWTPDPAGSYSLRVCARDTAVPSTVVTKVVLFSVSPALTAATLVVKPEGPQPINTAISLAAAKVGGAAPTGLPCDPVQLVA
ncbi:MAG: hypothetical protein ACYDBB_11290 [Armatimonadota bacterium]